ncbi:MAG: hypothetical protein K2I52_05580 [Muribaculaceae bacterium]|nr:hypothetical protein [Muribaculaceae bacterium]
MARPRGKDYNIARVVEIHGLETPLYIGDIQGDSDAAHAVGVPMGHVAWGFGKCHDAELSFGSFGEMTRLLTGLKG